MNISEVIAVLQFDADLDHRLGMERFGITTQAALGIPIPTLRRLAKRIGRDHTLAQELWESGIHEARILAAFVDKPVQVTPEQMDSWVLDFDSWDLCDQVCGNLFDRTPYAHDKALAWVERDEEFVRRAGFVLMAYLAVHNKTLDDDIFLEFFPVIRQLGIASDRQTQLCPAGIGDGCCHGLSLL